MTGTEPLWVPLIIGAMVTGVALTAYSQHQQRGAARAQARAEAAWQTYNAQVAQREAEYAGAMAASERQATEAMAQAERAATAFESKQQRRRAKALLARQRSLIGYAGVTMEGSPLLVAEDTAEQLALEDINIRMGGLRREEAIRMEGLKRERGYLAAGRGYRTQSILDISKAGASRRAGDAYYKAGGIGIGASILSGAAQTGYMGYGMRRSSTAYSSPWSYSRNF